jgi:2-keto-4-pentenoate hydratase
VGVVVDGAAGVAACADRIVRAHAERRVLHPSSEVRTLDEAYAVQRVVTSARLARGERLAGWKIGYASAAMRVQMGVGEPNAGPLTDAMLLPSGAMVPETVTQPRVEPEIALEIGSDGGVARARCALEVVDSVWRDYRFRLEDNTADGSSAAYAVLGPELPDGCDLAAVEVSLHVDGRPAGVATGAAAMGHPLVALRWLEAWLADRGEPLAPGDVVLTGGLTAASPLPPGSEVVARFGDSLAVSARRAASPPVEETHA